MRWYVWAMAGLLLTGIGAGCDDNEVPPEVLRAREQQQREQQERAATAASRPAPTTQQLLTGPKKTLKLGSFPLTLDVPQSWNIGSLGKSSQIITLSGPASSGEITIQLVQQGQPASTGAVDVLLAAAKKESAEKPYPVNRVELRPLGPGKVLEQRVISSQFVDGQPPAEVWGDVDTGVQDARTGKNYTTPGIINPRLLKWNFTVFLPADKDHFSVRGLNFLTLRLAEYEQDREFLEQMMRTLRYAQ